MTPFSDDWSNCECPPLLAAMLSHEETILLALPEPEGPPVSRFSLEWLEDYRYWWYRGCPPSLAGNLARLSLTIRRYENIPSRVVSHMSITSRMLESYLSTKDTRFPETVPAKSLPSTKQVSFAKQEDETTTQLDENFTANEYSFDNEEDESYDYSAALDCYRPATDVGNNNSNNDVFSFEPDFVKQLQPNDVPKAVRFADMSGEDCDHLPLHAAESSRASGKQAPLSQPTAIADKLKAKIQSKKKIKKKTGSILSRTRHVSNGVSDKQSTDKYFSTFHNSAPDDSQHEDNFLDHVDESSRSANTLAYETDIVESYGANAFQNYIDRAMDGDYRVLSTSDACQLDDASGQHGNDLFSTESSKAPFMVVSPVHKHAALRQCMERGKQPRFQVTKIHKFFVGSSGRASEIPKSCEDASKLQDSSVATPTDSIFSDSVDSHASGTSSKGTKRRFHVTKIGKFLLRIG